MRTFVERWNLIVYASHIQRKCFWANFSLLFNYVKLHQKSTWLHPTLFWTAEACSVSNPIPQPIHRDEEWRQGCSTNGPGCSNRNSRVEKRTNDPRIPTEKINKAWRWLRTLQRLTITRGNPTVKERSLKYFNSTLLHFRWSILN